MRNRPAGLGTVHIGQWWGTTIAGLFWTFGMVDNHEKALALLFA